MAAPIRLNFLKKCWHICRIYHPNQCIWRNATNSAYIEQKQSPLGGIRVLDLSRVLAGPYCSMILGDLGAEIIKVERPDVGDETRQWAPPWVNSETAYFLSINRNKKSVAVDLKSQAGQKVVQELAKASDVLLENYLPGKLDEMSLGYKQLQKKNPRLIYCSITGYGQTGPYKDRGGYDVIAAGMGGLMHITGPADGEPCRVGVAMTDLSTGLYAYGAILAALIHRNKTGRGQHIDCNLLSTQVATLTHIASNYLNAGMEAKRWGTGHGSIVPYQAFKTQDGGYIIVGAGNNVLFAEICQALGLDELKTDSRYTDNEKRVENRASLIQTMSDRFLMKTTKDWLDTFKGARFPFGPINNMEHVFNDPQVLHNGLIQTMEHPTAGTIRIPGPAVKYSQCDLALQYPAPLLGQHSKEILSTVLNYSPAEVEELLQQGVIQTPRE